MLEKYLPKNLCDIIEPYNNQVTDITLSRDEYMYFNIGKRITDTDIFITKEMLDEIVARICNGSIYANQSTLKHGYITLKEGYRVGLTGTAVVSDEGRITHLRDISAINIRVRHVISGVADGVIDYITEGGKICNTLIIAPPGAGKTTLLGDIAFKLSESFRVGIADEREEISQGRKIGKHAFVMRGGIRSEGMLSLLRSMSPEVIVTDEIGTEGDEKAILYLINAGVKVICTVHGYSERDIMRRQIFARLIKEKVFERMIILSSRLGPGTVEKIINTEEDFCNGEDMRDGGCAYSIFNDGVYNGR